MVLVDSPTARQLFSDEFLAFASETVKRVRVGIWAARFGWLRLDNPMFDGPVAGLTPTAQAEMKALTAAPGFLETFADDMRSIADASPELRARGALGSLGDRPLLVITHGIPFPSQAGPLEAGWHEGQRQLTTLSSNSALIVAERSGHQIFLDQPDVVIDAISRVYRAARDRSRLDMPP